MSKSRGLSKEASAPRSNPPSSGAPEPDLFRPLPQREVLKLGNAGRLVIPAALREAMGVEPGDTLIARVDQGELRLSSRQMALRRVQSQMAKLKKPGESVVDEFLAERRALWGEE